MTEPMYTTDCRNGHHGRLCGMTPCSCICHANERPPAEIHRTCKDPRCHNLDCLVQSESESKCYCLPGPPRCDDDTACDRYRLPVRELLELVDELKEKSHDEEATANRYELTGQVGAVPTIHHSARGAAYWDAACRLDAIVNNGIARINKPRQQGRGRP